MTLSILRFNYDDIMICAKGDNTRFMKFIKFLYNKKWFKFNKCKLVIDPERWNNYIIHPNTMLYSKKSLNDKVRLIELASYRELANYKMYGDTSIDIDLVNESDIQKLPLITINNRVKILTEEI